MAKSLVGKWLILGVIFLIISFFIFSNQSLAQTQPSGKIAFVKSDNIWLVNADGADLKQITTDNDSDLPCWLYDGRLVVGRAHQTHPKYGIQKFPTEIWVMNLDGSGVELLLKTERPFQDLGCSTKEPKITYSQIGADSGRDIFLFEIDGTPKNLTNQPSSGYASPSFSPDGKRILFSKYYRKDPSDDIHSALFSMNLSGSDEQLLVDDPMEYYSGPVLSPIGDKLAFWRASSRNVGIHDSQYLMLANADGTDAKVFRPDFGGADQGYTRWDTSRPDFSADGKYLVFEVRANKVEPEATPETSVWEDSIWVAPVEGGKATKIADGGAEPVWQKGEAKATTGATESVKTQPTKKSNKPTASDIAIATAVGAIASAAFTLIMSKVTGIKGKPGAGGLIKLAVYALTTFVVAGTISVVVAWKIRSSQNITQPSTTETEKAESVQLSEEPNTAKFKEYFSDLYLAKPPPGVEIPASFEAIKTTTFSPSDRLCILGSANKIIATGAMATAIYDVTNKKYVKEKSPLNITGPVPTGSFTEECKPITFPAGKYERKIYINDVLVAVLPFLVR